MENHLEELNKAVDFWAHSLDAEYSQNLGFLCYSAEKGNLLHCWLGL